MFAVSSFLQRNQATSKLVQSSTQQLFQKRFGHSEVNVHQLPNYNFNSPKLYSQDKASNYISVGGWAICGAAFFYYLLNEHTSQLSARWTAGEVTKQAFAENQRVVYINKDLKHIINYHPAESK